jgi:single-stranded DNA-binding protein
MDNNKDITNMIILTGKIIKTEKAQVKNNFVNNIVLYVERGLKDKIFKEYYNVEYWNKDVEVGKDVKVVGKLVQDMWEKEGKKHYMIKIVADNIEDNKDLEKINKIIIAGNAIKVDSRAEGKVISITLAHEYYKNTNKEYKEKKVSYIEITKFNNEEEMKTPLLYEKGKRYEVLGKIRNDIYEYEGKKNNKISIVAENIAEINIDNIQKENVKKNKNIEISI